jgi:hypothetical protein
VVRDLGKVQIQLRLFFVTRVGFDPAPPAHKPNALTHENFVFLYYGLAVRNTSYEIRGGPLLLCSGAGQIISERPLVWESHDIP